MRKDKREAYFRHYRYGLTPQTYAALLADQQGVCGICEQDVELHEDHDHTTKTVRGLLCQRCNQLLGHMGDTYEQVTQKSIALLAYLNRTRLRSLISVVHNA